MNTMIYLLQVSACMAIFFGLYYFILSKLTFFTINRWYLMATLTFSFIIPLLTITVDQEYVLAMQRVTYVDQFQNLSGQQQDIDIKETLAQPDISWLTIIKVAYFIIALALFIRLIIIMSVFFARIKRKNKTRIGHIHIVHGNKNLRNGSFLNYIFLNHGLDRDKMQQVIQHEMLHVKLLHSVDRIILEIIHIVLWFNPFIYLYSRAVEENHEYEVDQEIGRSADKNKYADLLLHLSVANQKPFCHSFSKIPLEKRITMLFNQPTKSMKKIIYVLILPVGIISCLAFANLEIKKGDTDIIKSDWPSKIDTSTMKEITLNREPHHFYDKLNVGFDSQTQSSQFYTRLHIQDKDGKNFDKITFKLANGAASANLGEKDKVGAFIDGAFYDEDQILKLPIEKTARLTFDNSKDSFKLEKIPKGNNYAIPFSFKSKINE